MKKSLILAAACVIAAAGCTKESFETASSRKLVPVSIEIGAPSSKVALDGSTYAQTWVAGDSVAIASYYKIADNNYANYMTGLEASSSGSSSSFIGMVDPELLKYSEAYNFVISPKSSIEKCIKNGQYVFVPSSQTGKLSDFGKYSINYSRYFKLVKSGESYVFPSYVGKLHNLTPAIKFNIAQGNKVRKILIYGYNNGTQVALPAKKSTGSIYLKLLTPQIYSVSSDIKYVEIDRNPDVKDLADKEEIYGDVYAVFAPNFPQNNKTWKDSTYSFNDTNKNPFNVADSLVFHFINVNNDTVSFGKKLVDDDLTDEKGVLEAGTIVNLGNITKISFPAPKISLSLNAAGNLRCSPGNEDYTFTYEMSDGKSVPADPTLSSSRFTDTGIEFSKLVDTVFIKVAQYYGNQFISAKNAYLVRFYPKSGTSITLEPGQSATIGFANVTNVHDSYKVIFSYDLANTKYTLKHRDASGKTPGSGEYSNASFKSRFPGAEASFYFRQNSHSRTIYLIYYEGEKSLFTGSVSNPTKQPYWYTGSGWATKTVTGNGKVVFYSKIDSTPIGGFAWIEQGFESFTTD